MILVYIRRFIVPSSLYFYSWTTENWTSSTLNLQRSNFESLIHIKNSREYSRLGNILLVNFDEKKKIEELRAYWSQYPENLRMIFHLFDILKGKKS